MECSADGRTMMFGDPHETLNKVIKSLRKHVEDLAILEYPRRPHRRSIDVVAKFADGKHVFMKITNDTSNISKHDARELRDIASVLNSGALIVADYMRGLELPDDIIFKVHNVKVLNVNTLKGLSSGKRSVYVYQSGDMFKVKIDGDAMRRERIKKGLSLGDVARELGVTRRTVYEYERGFIEPTVERAEKLIELLGDEILEPVNILECPPKSKPKGVEEYSFDTDSERIIARKLVAKNFNIVHAKRTAVDIVGARGGEGLLFVVMHGRESFESLKLKAINLKKLARISNTKNHVVVEDRELKRDLEKEGLEVYTVKEINEILS